MVLHKKHLKRAGFVALIVGLVAIVAVGVTVAAGSQTVTIITEPLKFDETIYVDLNQNGEHEPEELVGVFDVYDGNAPITFTWEPYAFASGVNGSYRIALWQNTTPFEATPTWAEYKVSHHWADNPNGTMFTLGAFDFGEKLCTTCPTIIVVQAETYEKIFDWDTSTYVYEYTLIGSSPYMAALTNGGATQTSDEFIIEIFRPFKSKPCDHPAVVKCQTEWCDGGTIPECVAACVEWFSQFEPYYTYDREAKACVCTLTVEICIEMIGGGFIQDCACLGKG